VTNIVVLANCYFPEGIDIQDLENVLNYAGEVDKLIILGDFLDFPKNVTDDFILKLEKPLHKLFNRIVRYGCRDIIYVVGDRDRILQEAGPRLVSRLFSTRAHIVRVCTYHVMNIGGTQAVFSHGHNQINIAIMEELSPEKTDEKVLIDAARRARRKEEVAGLRGALPRESWWFVGHTTLLYIDKEYRIVHVGYLSKFHKISGCGPYTSGMYVPETHRGFVLINLEKKTIELVHYPDFRIVDKIKIS
jgi:hypothetical protein